MVSSLGALRRASLVLLLSALIWGSMIPVLADDVNSTNQPIADSWRIAWWLPKTSRS